MPFQITEQGETTLHIDYFGVVTDKDYEESANIAGDCFLKNAALDQMIVDTLKVEDYQVTNGLTQKIANLTVKHLLDKKQKLSVYFIIDDKLVYGMFRMWSAYANSDLLVAKHFKSQADLDKYMSSMSST